VESCSGKLLYRCSDYAFLYGINLLGVLFAVLFVFGNSLFVEYVVFIVFFSVYTPRLFIRRYFI
jgi:hypothetical protein